MPYLVYALAVEKVLKDAESGKPSLIGIYDIVFIPKGQTKTYELITIAGKIKGIPAGNATIEVYLEDKDKIIISKKTLTGTNLSIGPLEFHTTFPLIEFTKQEIYYLRVKFNGELLSDDDRNTIFVYQIV